MCLMPSALPIDTAITRPRALNDPVGKRPSSFTMISPPPSLLGKPRQPDQRRHHFAKTDNVGAFPHREHLAIAPQIRRPLRQRILAQRLLHAGEVVAHQQRLAGLGEIVDLVGRIMVAFHRAFEMGHECRALDRQIVIVFHGISLGLGSLRCSARGHRHPARLPSSSRTASGAGKWCASVLLRWFRGSWQPHNPGSVR